MIMQKLKKYYPYALSFLIFFISFFFIFKAVMPIKFQANSLVKIEKAFEIDESISGITGFSLGGALPNDRTQEIISVLNSLTFYKEYIFEEEDLKKIIAYKKFDFVEKKDRYIEKIYDEDKGLWKRKPNIYINSKPTFFEAWKKFTDENLNIVLVRESGFLKITIIHQSPEYALSMLTKIIDKANLYLSQKDRDFLSSMNVVLEEQISRSQNLSVQNALSEKLSENLKKIATIDVEEEYILKQIEIPYVGEKPYSPRSSILALLSMMISIALTILFAFIRGNYRKFAGINT